MLKRANNKDHEQWKAENFSDFLKFVLDQPDAPSDRKCVLYRGQRQFFRLIPDIGRYDFDGDPQEVEKRILREFRLWAAAHIRPDLDEWDLLALARHHGLPTRLLDWTDNPMAALYFASRDEPRERESMSVWRLCVTEDDLLDAQDGTRKEKDPFVATSLHVFRPKHVSERIAGQAGWMTSHPKRDANYWKSHKCWYTDLKRQAAPNNKHISEIILKHECFNDIRSALRQIGIHNALLFPGLDGICRTLREAHLPIGYGSHHRDWPSHPLSPS